MSSGHRTQFWFNPGFKHLAPLSLEVALGETSDLGNVVSGHIAFIPVFGLLKK